MKRGGILFKILMVPLLLAFGLFLHINIVSGDYPIEQFSLNSGREIFDSNCAGCHGEKGDGSVFKGAFDFTGKLSIPQRWDVVSYLWTFWMDFTEVEHGKTIYQKNCASCHGINGDGSGITGAFDFTNVSRMVREDPEVIFTRVSDGVDGTSMPSWKDSLSVDERWNIVKYIWTFQFKGYFQIRQPSLITPNTERTSSGEAWYSSPIGMAIIAISILLAIAVLYLFGKGMKER